MSFVDVVFFVVLAALLVIVLVALGRWVNASFDDDEDWYA